MDNIVSGAAPTPPPSPAHRPNWGAAALVILVEGVSAAVIGAFLTTGSVQLTLIVAAVVVAVVGLVVLITCR